MTSPAPPSEKEPAVFDASPLIFFDVLGYAERLPELHRILVPPAVIEELAALPGEPGSGLPAENWLEQRAPRAETLRRVEGEMTEGRGEKQAIALALELSAVVVLDDKRARNYARRIGLRLTGTLGVLLRVHRTGLALLASGGDLSRCKHYGRVISHASPAFVGDQRGRKPRKDKEFCDSRCRQNYHYHHRIKGPS